MPYIGTSPSNGVRRKHTYTATSGQTSFSGAGAEGATLSYNDSNFVDVYQNGVKLAEEDYTATSGTAIVLAQGASADDVVEIIVFDVFSVADTVSKSAGGTFDGNITAGGTLGVTGVPTFTGRSVHSGGITVANAGQIGSVGDADAIAIASNGVVTFSQKPVFSSGGGGSMELLSTQTASNSTGIIFDSSLITDTYNNYFIIGHNMSPATDTASPELYMSIDDGANYNLSVGTGRAYLRLQGAGSGHEHENTTDSSIQMGNSQSNLAAEAQSFFGYLQNLRSAAEHKHAHGTYSGGHSAANDAYSWRFGARVISTSKINNVKFDFHTGNFDGVISLYGIRG